MEKTEDTRYPYTYACDFIRAVAGYREGGTKLSRSDASRIRQEIGKIIGKDDHELACALADHYLKNQQVIDEKSTIEAMTKIFGNQCIPSDPAIKLEKSDGCDGDCDNCCTGSCSEDMK